LARKKISEYRAKTILYDALSLPYTGVTLDTAGDWQPAVKALSKTKRYVVKVDEGVKGRFKKGLVALDRTTFQLPAAIRALQAKGFRYLLIEEYQPHDASHEYYLSLERARVGNLVTFSTKGGVNVEQHAGALRQEPLASSTPAKVEKALGLPAKTLAALTAAFDDNYFSFLEINPLVATQGAPRLLDAAVEVDGEAEVFAHGRWTQADFRGARAKTPEEAAVTELADQSQASFALEVLNPDGQIFLLLSGGGASVVLADEVHNQGYGRALGNYGEYSGNPNAEESAHYTRQVLSLLIKSKAKHKVLVIGGGVANFTDIRATFKGLIQALGEAKAKLAAQHVKVFVRRGGPFEREGLAQMRGFLEHEGLLGAVSGPDMALSDIIPQAIAALGTNHKETKPS
jgi:succinyl-CoA synthetase beta subunit